MLEFCSFILGVVGGGRWCWVFSFIVFVSSSLMLLLSFLERGFFFRIICNFGLFLGFFFIRLILFLRVVLFFIGGKVLGLCMVIVFSYIVFFGDWVFVRLFFSCFAGCSFILFWFCCWFFFLSFRVGCLILG